jgi:hypothetical protein
MRALGIPYPGAMRIASTVTRIHYLLAGAASVALLGFLGAAPSNRWTGAATSYFRSWLAGQRAPRGDKGESDASSRRNAG